MSRLHESSSNSCPAGVVSSSADARRHSIEEVLEAAAIRSCPVCLTALVPLKARPSECPRCGFEYDEQALCFFPSGKWRFVAAVAAVWMAGVSGLELWRQARAGTVELSWSGVPWMAALSFCAAGAAIVFYLVDARKRQFLALRSRDIFWRRRGSTDHSIPWESVVSVSASRFSETVTLKSVDGSQHEIPRIYWPKSLSIEEFGEIVREHWIKATGREAIAA